MEKFASFFFRSISRKRFHLQFHKNRFPKQLTASFDRTGLYLNLIDETKLLSNDFNVRKLKIKSDSMNGDIPEEDINYHLYCDKKCNYFKFHYKLPILGWEIERFCVSYDLYLTKNV